MNVLSLGIISKRTLRRKGLLALMLSLPLGNITVVVEASTAAVASKDIIATRPDILLVDCDLSPLGLDSVRYVRTVSPTTKCLLLTDEAEDKFAVQAVGSGAWGVVSRLADATVMGQAIKKIASGEMWFSHRTMTKAVHALGWGKPSQDLPFERLTSREAEVLILLATGYHNNEIARRLCLSESTVRTYIEAIYRKTGVKSRVEAAIRLRESSGACAPAPSSAAKWSSE